MVNLTVEGRRKRCSRERSDKRPSHSKVPDNNADTPVRRTGTGGKRRAGALPPTQTGASPGGKNRDSNKRARRSPAERPVARTEAAALEHEGPVPAEDCFVFGATRLCGEGGSVGRFRGGPRESFPSQSSRANGRRPMDYPCGGR